MKALKVKLAFIIALALAAIVAVSCGLYTLFAKAERQVTVSGSNIFVTSGGAEVWGHKDGDADDASIYTSFVLKDGDSGVAFRKNMAYRWFYNDGTANDDEALTTVKGEAGWFNMELGFELGAGEVLPFEKFVITFESQQYYKTKDEKSTNYIVLYPCESEKTLFNVLITSEQDEKKWEDMEKSETPLVSDHFKIEFTGYDKGVYAVKVSDTADNVVTGSFVNVGGNYAKYSTSTTTPVTPLNFSAKYPETQEENAPAFTCLAMYNLNGQSFKLSGATLSNGHYVGGTINDDTPPVLCLDKGLSFIKKGEELSFNYTAIDVLASYPSITTSYFMLTQEQFEQGFAVDGALGEFKVADNKKVEKKPTDFYKLEDEKYVKLTASTEYSEDLTYYEYTSFFKTVTSGEQQLMIPHKNHYLPTANDCLANGGVFEGEDVNLDAAVKVCLKITDTTSTGGTSAFVLLDWYVDEQFKLTVNDTDYIAVASDEAGATFLNGEDNWTEAKNGYQASVTENAKDLKAGSKNYFYLPSLENLVADNVTAYSDLTVTVFYMTEDSTNFQSVSDKSPSDLSITLNKDGNYVFTFLVTDAAGNKMYYMDKGEKVEIENSTANILKMYKDEDNEGLYDRLPWFYFKVSVPDVSIKDPGEQDTAYVGTIYSSIDFEVSSIPTTTYNLYVFKNDLYLEEKGVSLTYEQFMDQKEELFTQHRNWFKRIKPASELSETDEDYNEYSEHAWDNSALSFVPQDANSYYLVVCKSAIGKLEEYAYMGISASPKVRDIAGEDTWVQDNLVSVILLCVAGVSLVGIVLLLVIKPKNADLDEALELETKPKKSKKK